MRRSPRDVPPVPASDEPGSWLLRFRVLPASSVCAYGRRAAAAHYQLTCNHHNDPTRQVPLLPHFRDDESEVREVTQLGHG